MISHEQRAQTVDLVEEARSAGARLAPCCEVVGISVRTYQRWVSEDGVQQDGRPHAERMEPSNKLSQEEKRAILEVCQRKEFASLPPTQIVPKLADEGEYLASESTFYRVLKEYGQLTHRGRARKPRRLGPPRSWEASHPCEVWSWDITWLPGPVRGMYFYLYLIIDIYSRKVVGWEVHEKESAQLAAEVVKKAILSEQCTNQLKVLHADNGSPQKGSHLAGLLESLGVERSHSRPRVSNDNAYSEAIFRTCKYRPQYPSRGFKSLVDARTWVDRFVRWYNQEHQHSALKYVTPQQRHEGKDRELLNQRKAVYTAAREKHPQRWSRGIRNFEPIGAVILNPPKEVHSSDILTS